MAAPRKFKPADFGGEIAEICNAADNALYKSANLVWSRPKPWEKGGSAPIDGVSSPSLYILVRNHGNSNYKDNIEYIGLARDPSFRFNNHPKAKKIVNMRGSAALSLAPIDFIRGRDRLANEKRALEELEHILIWALGPVENERKVFMLPGMGTNRANAWHISNSGYRFAGQMPREIVFPWMLVKPGRDRTFKS